jgi:hypothetical protein
MTEKPFCCYHCREEKNYPDCSCFTKLEDEQKSIIQDFYRHMEG